MFPKTYTKPKDLHNLILSGIMLKNKIKITVIIPVVFVLVLACANAESYTELTSDPPEITVYVGGYGTSILNATTKIDTTGMFAGNMLYFEVGSKYKDRVSASLSGPYDENLEKIEGIEPITTEFGDEGAINWSGPPGSYYFILNITSDPDAELGRFAISLSFISADLAKEEFDVSGEVVAGELIPELTTALLIGSAILLLRRSI